MMRISVWLGLAGLAGLLACSRHDRPAPPAPDPALGAQPRTSLAADAGAGRGTAPQSSAAATDAGLPARMAVTGAQKIGKVVDCGGGCEGPELSPDGQQLIYDESPGMMKHPVFLLPAKKWRPGHGAVMEDEIASGLAAHWMPDGKALVLRSPAFEGERSDGVPHLVVVATTGSGGGAINSARKSHDPTCPSPSPDGRRVVFERAGAKGSRELAVVDIDNVGLKVLGPGQCPEWGPGGHAVAFVLKGALMVVDPDGGAPRQVAAGPGFFGRPGWSPDGVFLVAARGLGNNSELVAMHADGSDPAPVTLTRKGNPSDPAWASDGFVYYALGNIAISRLQPILSQR